MALYHNKIIKIIVRTIIIGKVERKRYQDDNKQQRMRDESAIPAD